MSLQERNNMINDVIAQFSEAMKAHGLIINEPIQPNTIRAVRFKSAGDSRRNGWYRVHTDGDVPRGAFGHYKMGIGKSCAFSEGKWHVYDLKQKRDRSDGDEKFTLTLSPDEERAAAAKRKERQRLRDKAKEKAQWIWDNSLTCPESHPYTDRKKTKPLPGTRLYKGSLLIRAEIDGKLQTLQYIPADEGGDKWFSADLEQNGSYFLAGDFSAPKEIIICEGYATAASLYEATGLPTVLAFNCKGLVKVAPHIAKLWPDARIIIAADDDFYTQGNPGMSAAQECLKKIRATIRFPIFPRERTQDDTKENRLTDFNDLVSKCGLGLDEIRHQLEHGRGTFQMRHLEIVRDTEIAVPPPNDSAMFFELLPHQKPGKNPVATAENLSEICHRAGIVVRYNIIKKEEEILVPGTNFSLDNMKNASLSRVIGLCNRFRMPVGNIDTFLSEISDIHQYNPVRTWIESKPWDGIRRLSDFFATVTARGEKDAEHPERAIEIEKMKCSLMYRWMISAVAAAYEPFGVSAHGVLVLQGAQNMGKTYWCRKLVPEKMDLVATGRTLNPSDVDSVTQCISYWIVELGELDATFRKSDIAHLKAFLTKDRDVLRPKYARRECRYPRRTVFFASVNQDQFLADDTGNRRYWTIECEKIDHNHTFDMQQVWAEVHQDYFKGEGWFLTPNELEGLNNHNQKFEITDPIEDAIVSRLHWDDLKVVTGDWKSVTDVLRDIGFDRVTSADVRRAAALIRKLNGHNERRTKTKRLLLVPKR
jgi:putative DNA primase/helicase